MERTADAVVVGAGLAGLAAADRLRAAGASAIVLEARDRVGGRVLNATLPDGRPIDVGGQWVGPTQRRALAFIERFGLVTFPTHARGHNLLERGNGTLIRYRGSIPRINPAVLLDLGQAQLRIDAMAQRVPLEAPWRASRAARWDAMTVASWLRRNVASREARDLLGLAVAAVWACEPEDLSLLHLLFYIRSGGRFDDLIGTEGGAQAMRVEGGTQQLATRLAAELGDAVVAGAPVRRITRETVVADGVTVAAPHVIVAVPPALAGRIEYDPPLPADRDALTQRLPMGSVVKAMAVFDEPFWREQGLSGQAASVTGPARVVFDNTPADGAPGILLGFLEGRHARGGPPPRDGVVGTFARLFGPRAAKPDAYLEHDWTAEPWSRGCYTGLFVPGAWTGFGHALREPAGRIHWAGTETALRWSGYIDGAISSGERAADAVLARMA